MSISTILTKSIPTFLLLAMCGGLLSACSSQPPKPLLKHAESAGFKNADSYVDRRTRTLIGTTLASTNNVCVDHFNFLKEAKSGQYQGYSNDYNELAKGYRFLNTNKNIMDEDAKKVYTMMLEMKLDTLCSKVQYSGYSIIKIKMKELSSI